MPRKIFFYLLPIALYILTAGCGNPPRYQEYFNIPGNSWDTGFHPEFHIDIKDTAAAYQLIFLIRHTDNYPFNNIWLRLDTKAPGDTVFQKLRVEIPLAAPTGQWLGRGMGELYEQHVAINREANPAFFQKKGIYTIRMAQVMRVNALPDIVQVGLRLNYLGIPAFKH